MIELRIEGIKVDIKDDLPISFTYQTIDPDKLSTIKNSFSKTVDLPGTKRNNDLFGDLFRIDRYIPSRLVDQTYTDIDYEGLQYSGVRNIGFQFDPHKKAEFLLLSNGTLVQSGYCTLNEIVVKDNNEVTYKITLYGGIGNFFYNLTYNEDGTPKTLFDMLWNWRPKTNLVGYDEPLNREDEDNESTILFNASTSIICQSYHNLIPEENIYYADESYQDQDNYWWQNDGEYLPYPITDINKDVVFVPCYTGKYNDFDSDKMLVSTFNWNYSPEVPVYSNDTLTSLRNMFPDSFTDYSNDPDNPVVYNTLNISLEPTGAYRYGIVKFSRELDPWEAGDIRVNEMPVALRLSKILRTISMPWNNGGYDVEWDEDITNSPYWKYSWVMLGKINQEIEEYNLANITVETSSNSDMFTLQIDSYSANVPVTMNAPYTYEANIINYNDLQSGTYKLTLNLNIEGYFERGNRYVPGKIINGYYYYSYTPPYQAGNHTVPGVTVKKYRKNICALVYEIYSDNVKIDTFAVLCFMSQGKSRTLTDGDAYVLANRLKTYLGLTDLDFMYYTLDIPSITYTEDPIADKLEYNVESENIKIEHSFTTTNGGQLLVKQTKLLMFVDYSNLDGHTAGIRGIDSSSSTFANSWLWGFYEGSKTSYDYWPGHSYDFNYKINIDSEKFNGVFLLDTSGFKTLKINKQMLFSESKSPFKYMSDVAKILNWKFVVNDYTKKVSIMPMKKYYKEYIIDIDSLVDYSREMVIKNITTNYKFIDFGLPNLETYPISLFNTKNKNKFNIFHYDTLIEYNDKIQGLLSDSIYKNTLDWQQNSIFYNIIPQIPRAADTPSISWNLFNIDTEDSQKIKQGEIIVAGNNSNNTSLLAKTDFMPKMSFFNKENTYTGNDTVLMFLNGFVKNYDYNKLSESSQTETLTPDNINNNHYIKLSDYSIVSSSNYQIWEYNNIDENFEYRFSGRGPTNSAQAFVYYYNIGGTCIGYEYKISEGPNLTDVLLHLPVGTKSIKINMRKEYQSNYKVDKVTNTSNYTIHPRVNFSEDTYEQWYFNNNRCYVYDFKYNDNITPWGSWSSDQKGSATSWTLPFFTRELYNEYRRYENGYEYNTVRLTPYMKFPNTKFAQNNVILSNSNYSQFEFVIPNPEPGWEIDAVLFNATYPATESGDVLWLQDNGTATIDYQGEYSPSGQHTFVDGAVNTFGGLVKRIRMNTYVAQGGDETYYIDVRFRKALYYYRWTGLNNILASWNLVDQNQAALYELTNTQFLKDTSMTYSLHTNDISQINDNEYSINLSSYSYDSVFDLYWKDYMDDLYDRNTRDVTLYLDLTGLGMPDDILRKMYRWKGFLWIITKIDNRKIENIGQDKFTKVTLHKIKEVSTWT